LSELVYGWQSSLIEKLNFSTETVSSDESFKTGDAILYNAHITPLLEGGLTNVPTNPKITLNTGSVDPALAGRITDISGFDYPNRIFKVLDGNGSYKYLPFRCSPVYFSEKNIYAWMQTESG
jgi:hypothetical protein